MFDSQEVLDGVAFAEEFVGGLLDGSRGDLVVEVEALDWLVLSGGGGAWEGEHDAFWDVVEGSVGLEADGLPFVGAEGPVSHVVDGGVTGGGGR